MRHPDPMLDEKPAPRQPRLLPGAQGLAVTTYGRRDRRFGDLYARLMAAKWRWLLVLIVVGYTAFNLGFAALYLCLGHGIHGARAGSFSDAFFFSVQTFSTIGFGQMSPAGFAANLAVTCEAVTGFAFFAVTTGLVFAKFSAPTARVLYSRRAVIAPYEGLPHLMFRVANERSTAIVEANLRAVIMRQQVTAEGMRVRRVEELVLTRAYMPILRYSWTVMHKIDESSPLYGLTDAELSATEAEMILSLTGTDSVMHQPVNSLYSYVSADIAWNHVFVDILKREGDRIEIDYRLFHEVKPRSSGAA